VVSTCEFTPRVSQLTSSYWEIGVRYLLLFVADLQVLALGRLREFCFSIATNSQAGMCILSEAGGASYGGKDEDPELSGQPTSKVVSKYRRP
jgi:hypothetical protein